MRILQIHTFPFCHAIPPIVEAAVRSVVQRLRTLSVDPCGQQLVDAGSIPVALILEIGNGSEDNGKGKA